MEKKSLKRALSTADLLKKKYHTLDFTAEWYQAFSTPERYGIWFVWGTSGSGKSNFVAQLAKQLSRFGKVIYNSLEEADSMTIQRSFAEAGLAETGRRVILVSESMDDLSVRLSQPRSPVFAIVDSFQYTRMSYAQYIAFKEKHRHKLIIFVSHADGKLPAGRSARGVMYDAALKIWVEGYKAFSKGRYIGPNGGIYTIWDAGAFEYWMR